MSAEFLALVTVLIAIPGVGIGLAGLIMRLNRRIDRVEDRITGFQQRLETRFEAVEHGMAELRERMARLEGLLEGLRESIGRAVA